jgi:hypothetical protein
LFVFRSQSLVDLNPVFFSVLDINNFLNVYIAKSVCYNNYIQLLYLDNLLRFTIYKNSLPYDRLKKIASIFLDLS